MSDKSKEFLNLLNKINDKKKELKELKAEFDILSDDLLQYMLSKNLEYIQIENKKICMNETKSFNTINKDYILITLQEYIKEHTPKTTNNLAEKMTESLIENRSQKTKLKLKILKT